MNNIVSSDIQLDIVNQLQAYVDQMIHSEIDENNLEE